MTYVSNEKFMQTLFNVLKIKSVQSKALENAPFGEGPAKALNVTLSVAEELGFKTINYDNYVGEVIWGEGKGTPFGILCHLDVVPEGNLEAWNTDPFTPAIRDGKLFCRGALDDKSAAISSLFAMYALKSNGYTPKREIKLILGCNEESGWGCIEHYKKCAKLPEEGISPDADFPVIYAEKGILHLQYAFEKLRDFSIGGGTAANVVCDYAVAQTDIDEALAKELGLKIEDGKLCSFGKSAHGSTPEKGVNALAPLTEYLEKTGCIKVGTTDALFGSRLGATELCDETGYLTFSPNVVYCNAKTVYYTVDVRYPATLKREVVEKLLEKIGKYEVLSYQAPLYSDKNGKLVKTLTDIYAEYSGEACEPIAIGGGTYARALKNGVAFGASFDEAAHVPNEKQSLKNYELCFDIYKEAIKRLTK